jgi:hypothetical protein
VTVRARVGDLLRVRYNLRATGYLALVGSGITVLDLNRFYRLEMAEFNPGLAQCGRRLGRFEGEGIDFESCEGGPTLRFGIDMTTAVAPHGSTGCADGVCRGQGRINVYSPLASIGAIHSSSPDGQPGGLAHMDYSCLRQMLGTSAMYRDAALADEVRWLDRGIHGLPDGTFEIGDEELFASPEMREGDILFLSVGDFGVLVYDVSDR